MQNYKPSFGYTETDTNQIVIFDNGNLTAEIKNVSLTNAKFRPFGDLMIGEEYPLPLYWRQYSNHEDPDRNAGILISMMVECQKELITIKIKSGNKSRSIISSYTLEISYDSFLEGYVYSVDASLMVNSGWNVTYNPTHGEVEFLNIYPDKAFVKQKESKKKYNCFIFESEDDKIISLPNYHFDLKSYCDIRLKHNGKFIYGLEDENPVIQLMGDTAGKTGGGICSYMWDTHFGIRVCSKDEKIVRLENNAFNATYKMYSILREDVKKLLENSDSADISDISNIPFLHEGVNTFSQSVLDMDDKLKYWPFQTEVICTGGAIDYKNMPEFFIDRAIGFNDTNSLAIRTNAACTARWIYTSFGPEFGSDDLPEGKRIKITCLGKILRQGTEGFMKLSLRLRKILSDQGVTEFISYSSQEITVQDTWIKLTCLTPMLDFDFDRMHLLLEFTGVGECRFDDLEYGIIDD